MAQLYYRGMAEKSGQPKIGRSARLLGVRPGADIDVMLLERYEAAIANTQDDWKKVDDNGMGI
jgi:hypothetical protein